MSGASCALASGSCFGAHAGRVEQLTRRGQQAPFDSDVGTDLRGTAVVTFSRCHATPGPAADGPWLGAGAGGGCRLRLLNLKTRHEQAITVPHAPEDSDTWPSMWRGSVAFARTRLASFTVSHVMLRAANSSRLKRMHGGSVPTSCGPGRCSGDFTVEGLDLGSRLLSFSWHLDGSYVIGASGWEVRADRLSTSSGLLVGDGVSGEACTGATDSSTPSSPSSVGNDVWYAQLNLDCYVATSTLARVRTPSRRLSTAALPGAVLAAATSGPDHIVTLSTTAPTSDTHGPGCTTIAPCVITDLATPQLQPSTATFQPPLSG